MLKILDRNKVPVKGLKKYDDLCIESVLELDDRTLSFSAPYRNIRNAVVNEGYIETRTDRYVVKEIEKNTEGTAKVVAQLDLESLEGKVFREFRSEEQTIKSALQLAFAGTGWAIGVCEVNKKRTLSMSNVSALDVLKQALKIYRAEIKVNSKFQIISIYNAIGSDKGSYFANQLNLKSLTVQSTSYDFCTEIEPYGKDGLTIEAVNSGKTYLENHQYSSKVKRCIWKDERYTVPESLKEDAEAKLADMSKPYVSYSADVIDLAKCSEKYRILEYGIGDIITLIDDITDTREKQRIVGMKIYPDAPEKNSCTLANKVLTFDELAQKYEDTVNTVDNITNDNGQIDGDAIDGIYSRQIVDLENAIVSSVHIKDLDAKYVQVSGKLTAVEGEFGSIKGNIADFEDAYAKRLSAAEADIVQLRTTDLSAVNGRIDVLDSNYANIRNLLSGAAGIGDLQNIHLTSDNAVIDTALIREAVMQSVSIADLLAGTISTNKFLIASDDGGIRIQGATQQWSDTDGTVRMQAGRDANGDFTFSLFDKTGKGILIDATGVKPDAIADGLIVNKMVADNAGIAGSKLDISSVVSAINDSSQSIKSSRIWFDEEKQTLNQLYAQINKNITTIQLAAESASNTANTARDAIVTTNQKVSNIETGVEGLWTELSETTTDLHGLTDGTLLYNCYYHDNGDGTTTVTAVVYRAGQDVTAEFPEKSFSWIRKTEAGEQDLGYGYSITVKNSDYMFGGVVVGQFTTDVDENQRKALLSVQEGVVEIDGKPVSLSAEQKDYVDANTLSEVVTIPTGKKFIFTDAATNQGGTVALENLARQILLNLTTQTFELDQGTKTLPDALNELNRDLQYIPIEILAFSNNIGVAEKGSTLNELTLKWQLNKEPETILMNGQVRADLKTLRSLTLKDMALTADKTFMLQVTDEKGKTAQKNTSVVFQNGVYYGVSEIPEEVNNTFILSLSRSLQGSRTKTFSTTSTEDQYIWYAFPSRYGTPVFNVGGFDGGFTKAASISFTNASGYTEEYAVYRSDNSNLDTKTIKVT
ncbi:MAG: phage tail protein [Blautia sp.]